MKYIIVHQVISIVEADVALGPAIRVSVSWRSQRSPRFRPLIRVGSAARARVPNGWHCVTRGRERPRGSGGRGTTGQALELQQEDGTVVPTDFVELIEGALYANQTTVWARARAEGPEGAQMIT